MLKSAGIYVKQRTANGERRHREQQSGEILRQVGVCVCVCVIWVQATVCVAAMEGETSCPDKSHEIL